MRVPRPQPHLEEVLASEPGSHIAALFDFDGTIISGYSATAMLRAFTPLASFSASILTAKK